MGETIPKKMVSRDVAIVLGAACILLAVSLGITAYYTTYYTTSNTAYNDYVSSHSYSNSDYSWIKYSSNATITDLQGQVSDLTSALNLGKSITQSGAPIDIPATFSNNPWKVGQRIISMYPYFGQYAGFGYIQVSSTANDTYINVTYSSHGFDYSSQTFVGTNGTAIFPILPTKLIVVMVGTNAINAMANFTITYDY